MVGLAFSGGKDSLACLFLNASRLHEIHVLWVNTGSYYPEALKIVEEVRKLCPNFHEIKTDKNEQNRQCGLPSDLVPIDATRIGMMTTTEKPLMVQDYLSCCYANISKPLMDTAKQLGLKYLIRGQRNEEGHKATSRNGDVVQGITFLHPIEDWSEKKVYEYLKHHIDIPEHLYLKHSSLDCYDCTGYLGQSLDRMQWAEKNHPELALEHKTKLRAVREAIWPVLTDLEALCK